MKSQEAMENSQFENLRNAVKNLYYAAVWHPDRQVDEEGLWTAVRDAAGFPAGKSPKELPYDGISVQFDVSRIRQLGGNARATRETATDFTSEKARAFLLLHGAELKNKIDETVRSFIEEKLG